MNRIKDLRISLGLTQKNIAEKLGCNQTAVGKYEREELEPNIEVLCKLADIFNCSIDYIVCREDDFGIISSKTDNGFTYEENRLVQIYRTLSDRDKKMIDGIFNSFVSDVTSTNVKANKF